MKTEKSSTRKKSPQANLTEEQSQILNFLTAYIADWTKKELNSIRATSRKPVCIPYGDHGFIIDHFKLERIDNDCWRLHDRNDEVIHDFTSRIAGVMYCLLEKTGQYAYSTQLKNLDATLSRAEIDLIHYRSSVKRAKDKKDWEAVQSWTTRIDTTNGKLVHLRFQLEKTLRMAKYNKLWDFGK